MNRSKATGAHQVAPRVARNPSRSRTGVDVQRMAQPTRFECHEAEIPRITRFIANAGYCSPVDTNLRRQWGRSETAIVECDAEWNELAPILTAAGYTLGVA